MPLFGSPNIEKMKAKRDVPGLFRLMLANKGEASEKARQALVEIGPQAVLPMTREMLKLRGPAPPIAEFVGVVAEMGTPAVPALVAVTVAGLGAPAIYLATLALGAIGGSDAAVALQAIVEGSKTPGAGASVKAIAAAFVKDPPGARVRLPLLFGLPRNYLAAGGVSDAVAGSMGDAGVMLTIGALQGMGKSDVNAKELVVGQLGILGDRRATPALVRLLGDKSYVVRRAAALGLGLLGDPEAIAPLREQMQDRDPSVRQAASLALAAILAQADVPQEATA
jgi:hypothetical protein